MDNTTNVPLQAGPYELGLQGFAPPISVPGRDSYFYKLIEDKGDDKYENMSFYANQTPRTKLRLSDRATMEMYVEGLGDFLRANGVERFWLDGLFTYEGVGDIKKGLGRKVPDAEREDLFDRYGFSSLFRKPTHASEAYRIGFVVSAIKDFGVTLQVTEVPFDGQSYYEFISGMTGDTKRQIDWFEEQRRSRSWNYEARDRAAAMDKADEVVYLGGVKVWLASQGLKELDATMLLTPDAMRAFKAGLSGKRDFTYEPLWIVNQWNKVGNFVGSKLRKNDDVLQRYYREDAERRHTNAKEAYEVGKAARVKRTQEGFSFESIPELILKGHIPDEHLR